MNAKAKLDLYRLYHTEKLKKLHPMVVGVDVVNKGSKSIIGLAATYSEYLTQHFSRIQYQDLYRDRVSRKNPNRITKDQQEDVITDERTKILESFLRDAFKFYTKKNNGQQPGLIVLYRSGIGGPTLQEKVLKKEIGQIKAAVQGFAPNYDP